MTIRFADIALGTCVCGSRFQDSKTHFRLRGFNLGCARFSAGALFHLCAVRRSRSVARAWRRTYWMCPAFRDCARADLYGLGISPVLIDVSAIALVSVFVLLCASQFKRIEQRRRHAEDALRLIQAQLQFALEADNLGIWSWDIAADSIAWTDPLLKLHEIAREDLSDDRLMTFLAFVHAGDRAAVENAFQTAVRDGSAYQIEYRIRRPDGAFQSVAARCRLERDAQGRPWRLAGVCVDVTARKRLEETILQSHKMEELGTLAGGVAHDFNNILMAISGNIELAMEELPEGHPARQNLDRIDKAADRASNLVRQILTFSRQQSPRRTVTPLVQEIDDAVNLLQATLPARIEIHAEYLPGVPPVSIDATHLHQVLINLGTNASHAIGEASGRIEIRLDGLRIDDGRAETTAGLPAGSYARLSIRDTGCGMDKATLARAFEPFFTTKEIGKGTGLGLSVVHGIMKDIGGAVTVHSEIGIGTTFHLYFPAAEKIPESASGSSSLDQASRGNGERILYVDDEEALVLVTRRRLQQAGYEVTGCADPCEALLLFRSQPDQFDAIITDLSMPRLPGAEFVQALLHVRPDIPVIMCSGYLRAEDYEAAKRLGICELMSKPMDFSELARVLHRLLARDLTGLHS
jgi:signal transduction histidine kinase/CheY-like chemotaxis protein